MSRAAAPGGSYLLRLAVRENLDVQFGRFQAGRPVHVPRGATVYIGSAMRGIAARLLRHATRCQGPAHGIRPDLHTACLEAGLASRSWQPRPKRLHWHIDYLLEEAAVSLTHVHMLRSSTHSEAKIANILAATPPVMPLAAGLGASDHSGSTHLLRIPESLAWWHNLSGRLDLLG